jgi:thiol-disulfide isomerase/thioredoxin
MVTEVTMNDMIKGLPVPDNDIHIIMFYGDKCGPCQATLPNYEAAAKFFKERNARIRFYKIHAWEPGEQMTYCYETWKISGVPHFKGFCRGIELTDKPGGGDEETMKKYIHDNIDEVFKRFGERI